MYQFVTSSKIKMEVQVSNPQGLWLYLSDANSIIKQLEEKEKNIQRYSRYVPYGKWIHKL